MLVVQLSRTSGLVNLFTLLLLPTFSSVQNPHLQSTPYSSAVATGGVQPETHKSGRLAGLYLYLSRILG